MDENEYDNILIRNIEKIRKLISYFDTVLLMYWMK